MNDLERSMMLVELGPPSLDEDLSYVYFIRDGNQVKIGRSSQPEKRIQSLSVQAGREYETIAIVPETEHFTEAWCHFQARSLRILGEWFEATDTLIKWIDEVVRYHHMMYRTERKAYA